MYILYTDYIIHMYVVYINSFFRLIYAVPNKRTKLYAKMRILPIRNNNEIFTQHMVITDLKSKLSCDRFCSVGSIYYMSKK